MTNQPSTDVIFPTWSKGGNEIRVRHIRCSTESREKYDVFLRQRVVIRGVGYKALRCVFEATDVDYFMTATNEVWFYIRAEDVATLKRSSRGE